MRASTRPTERLMPDKHDDAPRDKPPLRYRHFPRSQFKRPLYLKRSSCGYAGMSGISSRWLFSGYRHCAVAATVSASTDAERETGVFCCSSHKRS